MNEHTPGPWVAIHEPGHSSADLTDNGGYRIDAPCDGVTQLAFVWVLNHRLPGGGKPQSDGPTFGDVRAGANARLIAAAPKMLSILKFLLCVDWNAFTEHDEALLDSVKESAAKVVAEITSL